MAVAALILGIISVVLAVLFSGWGWLAAILGLIAIILGAVAKKKGAGGAATAGIVLGIIGLALGVILYIACVACITAAGNALAGL